MEQKQSSYNEFVTRANSELKDIQALEAEAQSALKKLKT